MTLVAPARPDVDTAEPWCCDDDSCHFCQGPETD